MPPNKLLVGVIENPRARGVVRHPVSYLLSWSVLRRSWRSETSAGQSYNKVGLGWQRNATVDDWERRGAFKRLCGAQEEFGRSNGLLRLKCSSKVDLSTKQCCALAACLGNASMVRRLTQPRLRGSSSGLLYRVSLGSLGLGGEREWDAVERDSGYLGSFGPTAAWRQWLASSQPQETVI